MGAQLIPSNKAAASASVHAKTNGCPCSQCAADAATQRTQWFLQQSTKVEEICEGLCKRVVLATHSAMTLEANDKEAAEQAIANLSAMGFNVQRFVLHGSMYFLTVDLIGE